MARLAVLEEGDYSISRKQGDALARVWSGLFEAREKINLVVDSVVALGDDTPSMVHARNLYIDLVSINRELALALKGLQEFSNEGGKL